MSKIFLSIILTNLIFGNDIDVIKSTIKDNWEKTSQKKVGDFIHPDGSWLATSEGSFWNFQTPKENNEKRKRKVVYGRCTLQSNAFWIRCYI